MLPNKITIDSDVLIWYLRGDETAAEEIEYYLSHDVSLAASVIVILEILRGMRPNEIAATRALLESIEHINVDETVIEQAYEIYRKKRIRGKTLPFADSIIAATAIVAGGPLLTHNKKDYPEQVLI